MNGFGIWWNTSLVVLALVCCARNRTFLTLVTSVEVFSPLFAFSPYQPTPWHFVFTLRRKVVSTGTCDINLCLDWRAKEMMHFSISFFVCMGTSAEVDEIGAHFLYGENNNFPFCICDFSWSVSHPRKCRTSLFWLKMYCLSHIRLTICSWWHLERPLEFVRDTTRTRVESLFFGVVNGCFSMRRSGTFSTPFFCFDVAAHQHWHHFDDNHTQQPS